jgi:hypothetical protein
MYRDERVALGLYEGESVEAVIDHLAMGAS